MYLKLGDETYTRKLQRRGDSVAFGGDPFLDNPELADLFAFLLENNEARRAVARGDDLCEIIMCPIDTDSIDADICERKRERDDLEAIDSDRITDLIDYFRDHADHLIAALLLEDAQALE